ncbi:MULTISPECIES: DUF2530 domain-containing protein [unclassified Pseudofrankia]|uniref:DUF2530 domain-containing protein n=1 Tax=unclassified Pseudofrankia TaxID=2994372 RepID=UPI0009F68331|nr:MULTISPECIES: DUF2530 domain-containing protein [unclassified Pseudofrankia]MDT3445006.1 DUF2530 domain-containing protein [Pseudofrankia sp. BMG5.37]
MEAHATTSQGAGAAGREPDGPSEEPSRPDGVEPRPDDGAGGLAPLSHDGVGSVAVGTVAWLVALIIMLPFADDLRADGHLWWLATAACGVGLGLLGLVIVIRRRNRLRHAGQTAPHSGV